MGANGVALDAGFTTPDPEEAAVKASAVHLSLIHISMLTSSGQAANFFALFNLCEAGDHIVASSTIYGGTRCV